MGPDSELDCGIARASARSTLATRIGRRCCILHAMSDAIRFLLNGALRQVDDLPPTTTILDYLREHEQLSGSKEGCAEGDCGACTCVIVELHSESYRLRSINSCIQLLPTLNGKALITVEGLNNGGALHPVQRALVDTHGSQCGFCTPGFVMSLLTLFKHHSRPSLATVNHALSGNLCRCTGYRPIIDAASRMYELADPQSEDWLQRPSAPSSPLSLDSSEKNLIAQLRAIGPDDTLNLTASDESFLAPQTLDAFADAVASEPDATILAGCTDIGLWLTKQHRALAKIIYLGEVAELQVISTTDEHIEIGAGVNLTDAIEVLNAHYPMHAELWRRFASPPICNAGTLVGNIANGSPIGDSMPVLLSLDAVLTLRQGSSTRCLPISQFYLGYQQKDLAPGEFVQSVSIPLPKTGDKMASYKLSKRFDQDISSVCGAFRVRLDESELVKEIRIAYGGMAAIPARAEGMERALLGQAWNHASVSRAMLALSEDFSPIDDLRSSANYRRTAAANLLLKFFQQTVAQRPTLSTLSAVSR